MVSTQQPLQPVRPPLYATHWESAKVVKGRGQRQAKLEKTWWPVLVRGAAAPPGGRSGGRHE